MATFTGIANLFRIKSPSQSERLSYPIINGDTKLESETYVSYGMRICGKVTGSLHALSAYLPKIYNVEKQLQINNEQLQSEHRSRIADEISKTENQINLKESELQKSEQRIDNATEVIRQLKEKLIEARQKHGDVNKQAKVKLIIGGIILTILTVYLFVFYSSTFYSAFFKTFSVDNVSVGAAMFDSQALPHALSEGTGELLFILCAPIIFMGLGYGLHYFFQQKGFMKYLKTSAILVITFVFDCILAYLIAKKIYDIETMMSLGEFPDFTIAMAAKDVNVWAVIFCGFIVYLIWGIVFDMTMSGYEELRSNKAEIVKIETDIEAAKRNLLEEQQSVCDKKAEIRNMNSEIAKLRNDMEQNIHFNPQMIKTALSDFYSGWITMMSALDRPLEERTEADKVFVDINNQLFNK